MFAQCGILEPPYLQTEIDGMKSTDSGQAYFRIVSPCQDTDNFCLVLRQAGLNRRSAPGRSMARTASSSRGDARKPLRPREKFYLAFLICPGVVDL